MSRPQVSVDCEASTDRWSRYSLTDPSSADGCFVGHLTGLTGPEDGYVDAQLHEAGVHEAPSLVNGLPLALARPTELYPIELGAAVEIHEKNVGGNEVYKGFRVLRCSGGAPFIATTKGCDTGDVIVSGPSRPLPLPPSPTAPAPSEVHAVYQRARGDSKGLLGSALDPEQSVWWVQGHGRSHVVWTRASDSKGGFLLGVEPRATFVIGGRGTRGIRQ